MPVGRWVIRTAESVVLTDWPPGSRGPEDVDPQVRGIDVDVDVLGLRGDEDAGGGGVDAALGLGDRNPLHPVHAALVLQPGPHPVGRARRCLGLDRDRDVLVAAQVGLLRREHLGLPAAPLRVAQVHPQQVAGEQRRLLAALPGLDLDDHVLGVVGVARGEQLGELAISSSSTRCSSWAASAANDASSAASSRAAARSPRAVSSSAAVVMIGVSSAYRRPTRRATAWSACTAGSASWLSSCGVLGDQRIQRRARRRCVAHARPPSSLVLRSGRTATDVGSRVDPDTKRRPTTGGPAVRAPSVG